MIYLIIVALILTFAAVLYLIFNKTESALSATRRKMANEMDAEYRKYAALDTDLRDAGFELLHHSQFQHGRHQIHGEYKDRYFKILDYALVSASGVEEQTIIAVSGLSNVKGDFRVMPRKYKIKLEQDQFTNPRQSALQEVSKHELNNCRFWCSDPYHDAFPLMQAVSGWIEKHPGMMVEKLGDMLMVYKPATILTEQQWLQLALDEAYALAQQLTEANQ